MHVYAAQHRQSYLSARVALHLSVVIELLPLETQFGVILVVYLNTLRKESILSWFDMNNNTI